MTHKVDHDAFYDDAEANYDPMPALSSNAARPDGSFGSLPFRKKLSFLAGFIFATATAGNLAWQGFQTDRANANAAYNSTQPVDYTNGGILSCTPKQGWDTSSQEVVRPIRIVISPTPTSAELQQASQAVETMDCIQIPASPQDLQIALFERDGPAAVSRPSLVNPQDSAYLMVSAQPRTQAIRHTAPAYR